MSWTISTRAARRIGEEPMTGVLVCAVRAGVFTAVGTGLAVTGHHLVSGHPVPWRAALLAGVLLFALAVPAVRSERSLPAVIAATAGAQGALHMWFVRAEGHGAPNPHAVAHHGGPHEAWHAGLHGTSMTAAHIAAALLVAWCMQRADAASRSLGQRLGEVLGDFFVRLSPRGPLAAVPHVLRPVRARAQAPPRNSLVLAHAVMRRGPPAEFALAV
ncbi:hypothetical protein ACIHCQ_12345 [Streptomyces sp. NPDC052236]|uniref:hypothetical protein n=1 Tax=Streptomyces sp. NPDC052236 TaxID=3365686 RepID=UPI0037D6F6F2